MNRERPSMDIEQIMKEARGSDGIERRAYSVDSMRVERRDKDERLIVGHAAVFNQDADIMGYFLERVAPGAFKRAIAEDDVRSLFNHDPNFVLGRNKSGTLKLREDDTGLMTETTPPDSQLVRDLVMTPIERGDVSQMSFAFRVRAEKWEEQDDTWLRSILEVELFDISPVTFPAYPTTDVGLRSLEAFRSVRKVQGLTTINAAATIRRGLIQKSRGKGNFSAR